MVGCIPRSSDRFAVYRRNCRYSTVASANTYFHKHHNYWGQSDPCSKAPDSIFHLACSIHKDHTVSSSLGIYSPRQRKTFGSMHLGSCGCKIRNCSRRAAGRRNAPSPAGPAGCSRCQGLAPSSHSNMFHNLDPGFVVHIRRRNKYSVAHIRRHTRRNCMGRSLTVHSDHCSR